MDNVIELRAGLARMPLFPASFASTTVSYHDFFSPKTQCMKDLVFATAFDKLPLQDSLASFANDLPMASVSHSLLILTDHP